MPPMQIVPDGHCARHRPKNASRTRTATNKQTNSSSALALDATARPADSESLALATASMGESMKSKSSPFSTKTGRQCSSSRDVTSATERENDGQTPPAPQRKKRKHQEGNKKKNKTVPNRCKSKEAHVDKVKHSRAWKFACPFFYCPFTVSRVVRLSGECRHQ